MCDHRMPCRSLPFFFRVFREMMPGASVCAAVATQAILVLCRGIFTPQNDVVESKWQHFVFAAVFQPETGGYPLADAFAEVGVF